jgi:hypothetical protein
VPGEREGERKGNDDAVEKRLVAREQLLMVFGRGQRVKAVGKEEKELVDAGRAAREYVPGGNDRGMFRVRSRQRRGQRERGRERKGRERAGRQGHATLQREREREVG